MPSQHCTAQCCPLHFQLVLPTALSSGGKTSYLCLTVLLLYCPVCLRHCNSLPGEERLSEQEKKRTLLPELSIQTCRLCSDRLTQHLLSPGSVQCTQPPFRIAAVNVVVKSPGSVQASANLQA